MGQKSARLFDSHAHLDDERFDEDRDALIEGLPGQGVEYVINAGADLASSRAGIALAEGWPHVYAAVGVHPHDAKELDEAGIETLREMLGNPKVVAVGEIGLDYHYDYSPRDIQRYWFERQLALAQETSKPVIIHSREATEDTLSVLKKYVRDGVWGVMHAFSGSWETAEIVLNMGLMLGIGGTVTFKNAVKPVEVAGKVPMDRLLIETDCPYLTPAPHRGKRNEPAYVGHVAERIAEIRGIPMEDVIRATHDNACRLFGIAGEN
mgnify:CR=1 FL=1